MLAAATSAVERWEILVSLIAGVLVILGVMWRAGRKAAKAVVTQLEATTENTKAIKALTQRLDRWESHYPVPRSVLRK